MSDLYELKQLDLEQIKSFDTEYVTPEMYECITKYINHYFPDGEFTFMDVGGGNGHFTDRILNDYPLSNAILLDNSEHLIEINKPHPRKKLVIDSIENIIKKDLLNGVDLVFLNWVLHHLVSSSYKKSINNIQNVLSMIQENKNVKLISILENMYNGMIVHNLPSVIIYHLTSLKIFKRIMKKLGANTAGIGVCFLSKKAWLNILNAAGFNNICVDDYEIWGTSLHEKLLLHIGSRHVSSFCIDNENCL